MRILFAFGSPEYLRFYDATIQLLANRGHRVAIAVNVQKDAKPVRVEAVAGAEGQIVSLGVVPRRHDAWYGLAKIVRGSMDFVRYLDPRFAGAPVLRARMKRKALPPVLRGLDRIASLKAGQVRSVLRTLTRIETAIPGNQEIESFIAAEQPDVVLVSPLVDAASDQVDLIKSARSLGIPTAACIASWDNLTNKGLLRIEPDRVIVWNERQRTEAVELHAIPAHKVIVTGAQPFDRWFGKRPGRPREMFHQRVGLRGAEPFLLFVGSSMFISNPDSEVAFVRQWLQAVRSSPNAAVRDLPILIRPHPYNGGVWADVDVSAFPNVAVWPRGRHNPVDEANREDYFESLYYSLAVVGVNTSAMIEAAIVGRPVHSILADDFARTQEGTLHFHYLLPENGGFLRVARSIEEHVGQLAGTLENPGAAREQIDRFVESFIRPHGIDRPCTEILAAAIEQVGALGPSAPGRTPFSSRIARLALYPLTPLATAARSKRSLRQLAHEYVGEPLQKGSGQARRLGRRAVKRARSTIQPGRVARGLRSARRAASRGASHVLRRTWSGLRRARYAAAVAVKGERADPRS